MTLTFASMALSDATARFSLRHDVSDCAPSRHEAVNVSSSYHPLQIATRIMRGLFFFPRTMKGLRMNMELHFNDAVRQERDLIQYPTAMSTTTQMSLSDTTSSLAEDILHLFRFPMASVKRISRAINARCKASRMHRHICSVLERFSTDAIAC